MQETIIALGALMIITLIAVNQQRNSIILQEKVYLREMENMVSDLGKKRLEEILNQTAFDESRVGVTSLDTDVSTLTESGSLGPEPGENKVALYDDVDDYHGYQETISHNISADTLSMIVNYSVRYVEPSNPSITSLTPTLSKELRISVQSRDSISYRPAQFTISKLKLASDL